MLAEGSCDATGDFEDAQEAFPAHEPASMMEALLDLPEAFEAMSDSESVQAGERDGDKEEETVPAIVRRRAAFSRLNIGRRIPLLKDKLAFLLGCTMLWGGAYWLGRSPQNFYLLYSLIGLVLFPVRYFTYRIKRQHYYLLDFCYWANLLLLAHVWIFPKWPLLAQATFAFNTGPLTWSILAFRNSLVFHDLDKVTSLFLHLVPALVSWSQRWHPEAVRLAGQHERTLEGLNSQDPLLLAAETSSGSLAVTGGLFGLVAVPMALYLAWAIFYYLQIFVFSAKKIQQRGYQTLFKYVTSQKRGTFHTITERVPPQLHPMVYLLLHLGFCLCTLLLSVPCWHTHLVHTALLTGMLTTSIWSGASYYFEVFAQRYRNASAGT